MNQYEIKKYKLSRMTQLHKIGVYLTQGQKSKLARAYKKNEGVTIRLALKLYSVDQEVYRIEKVIRKTKDKALVKWKGYPDQFNSWVSLKDLTNLY